MRTGGEGSSPEGVARRRRSRAQRRDGSQLQEGGGQSMVGREQCGGLRAWTGLRWGRRPAGCSSTGTARSGTGRVTVAVSSGLGSMCCIGEVGRQVQWTARHWSGWWLGWQASAGDSVVATSADAAVRSWWCRRRSLSDCLLGLCRGLRLCSGSEAEFTDGALVHTTGRRQATAMGRQPESFGMAPAARPVKAAWPWRKRRALGSAAVAKGKEGAEGRGA
jgi:hypothetical protein